MAEISSNQRVAKNTMILYVRMALTLLVGVWTSRIILNALGFVDNGLYNVVGGFVAFFAIITSSQSSAISRFLTFEIGRGDKNEVNRIFQNSLSLQVIFSLIILILAETIGLWFVNTKLVFPADRVLEVNIIYQLSIATFIIGLLSVSQNALIIANEKMSIYAYVSIATCLARLAISFIIMYAPSNKLVLYAFLLFILGLGTRIFYAIYSKKSFPYCKYKFRVDKSTLKEMFGFAGWNFIGDSAVVLRTSGISVLLNMFAGPIANTINGIANQFATLVSMFVGDFTTAFNPQITKKYASQQYSELIPFLYKCCRFSFLLMALMAVPVFFNVDFILMIWLKKVPALTSIFIQITIVYCLVECISRPLITAKLATGKIKIYQIIVGGTLILTLPLAYLFLKLNLPIYYSYVAIFATSFAAFFIRLYMLRGGIPLWSSSSFLWKVALHCLIVLILCSLIPVLLRYFVNINPWLSIACSFLWSFFIIGFIGCNKQERIFIKNMLKSALHIKSK